MTTSNLAQIFSAPNSSPLIRSGSRWSSVLSIGMAIAGLGFVAESVGAQVTYYERPISATLESGVVSTNSGIGLNVRSGPGLNFPVIGGAEDGNSLNLIGSPVFANGYRWQRVTTGGWVATDYVDGNGQVNVSFPGGCWRGTACGGDSGSGTIDRPISLPNANAGPYVAAVPGGAGTLVQVQRVVGGAYLDRAQQGSFVNAGSFATYDGARAMASLLRANGLDARVIYK